MCDGQCACGSTEAFEMSLADNSRMNFSRGFYIFEIAELMNHQSCQVYVESVVELARIDYPL